MAVKRSSLHIFLWLGGPWPYNGHRVCMSFGGPDDGRLRLRLCTHTQPNDAERHVGRNGEYRGGSHGSQAYRLRRVRQSAEVEFTPHTIYSVLSSCGILVWVLSISLFWRYNLRIDDISRHIRSSAALIKDFFCW